MIRPLARCCCSPRCLRAVPSAQGPAGSEETFGGPDAEDRTSAKPLFERMLRPATAAPTSRGQRYRAPMLALKVYQPSPPLRHGLPDGGEQLPWNFGDA